MWPVVALLVFVQLFAVPLESEQFLFERLLVGLQLVVQEYLMLVQLKWMLWLH